VSETSFEPVRELRRPVQDGLRTLLRAAEAVLGDDPSEAREALDSAMRYLERDLFPHLVAEEWVLFTAIDGAFGQVGTAHIMAAFHDQLRAMAVDLKRVADAASAAESHTPFRRYLLPLLYSLYGAARAHFAAEDDSYLTFLESKLSQPQVDVIVENLERVAEEARTAAASRSPSRAS
jgi:hemerythrin-like domain-containing protein